MNKTKENSKGNQVLSDSQREKIFLQNEGLVFDIAKQYFNQESNIDFDDILQAGRLGLLQAIDRWDPNKGAITTYGYYWIRCEIFRFFASEQNYLAHVPSVTKNVYNRIDKIVDSLCEDQQAVQFPSRKQIAEHPDFVSFLQEYKPESNFSDEQKIDQIFGYYYNSQTVELYDSIVINYDNEDFEKLSFDPVDSEADFLSNIIKEDMIDYLLNKLSGLQRRVFCLYYGLHGESAFTFREIGKMLGITFQYVHLLHKTGIREIRQAAKKDDEIDLYY